MLILKRKPSSNDVTIGEIFYNDTFICATFELPWLDNKVDESCIPVGTYTLKRVLSNRLRRQVYTLTNVPGRSSIHIHPANKLDEIKGCIAPFMVADRVNGKFFGKHSGKALTILERVIRDNKIDSITIQ